MLNPNNKFNTIIMKRLLVFFTALLMFATTMSAGGKLTVSDVAGSKFSAKMVQGMNPIAGTDTYARIEGKKIVSYSFKTGKQVGVLLEADSTWGKKIDGFDAYSF